MEPSGGDELLWSLGLIDRNTSRYLLFRSLQRRVVRRARLTMHRRTDVRDGDNLGSRTWSSEDCGTGQTMVSVHQRIDPTLPKHSPSLMRPESRCHLGLPLCLRPRLMLLARDVEVEKMSVGTHGWGDEQKKDFALRISHPPHRTTEAFRSTIENRGDGSREPPPIKCRELLPMPLPTFPQFFSVSKTGA